MANDSATACEAQLTRREVDDIHLARQEVIDLFRCHVFALCLAGLHEVNIVLQQRRIQYTWHAKLVANIGYR